MAGSITVAYASNVTITETLDATLNPAAIAAQRVVTHAGFNSAANLTATTAVQVSKCANFTKSLSAGAGTIDLTALPGTNGATVDGTGLKVEILKIKCPITNTGGYTVTFGATNAYLLLGAAWKAIVKPGQELTFYGNDGAPTISGSLKNIDVAGTGTETADIQIVMG